MKSLDLSPISIPSTKFMLICFEKPALIAHLISEKLTLHDLLKVAQEGSDRNRALRSSSNNSQLILPSYLCYILFVNSQAMFNG